MLGGYGIYRATGCWTVQAEAAKFRADCRARTSRSSVPVLPRGVACMSLEANKIAAAILVGGMLTLSSGLIAN
jgi:hypothetical protein